MFVYLCYIQEMFCSLQLTRNHKNGLKRKVKSEEVKSEKRLKTDMKNISYSATIVIGFMTFTKNKIS